MFLQVNPKCFSNHDLFQFQSQSLSIFRRKSHGFPVFPRLFRAKNLCRFVGQVAAPGQLWIVALPQPHLGSRRCGVGVFRQRFSKAPIFLGNIPLEIHHFEWLNQHLPYGFLGFHHHRNPPHGNHGNGFGPENVGLIVVKSHHYPY